MALVFQYGSNTSSKRFNSPDRLRGDAVDLGLVCTQEAFELAFDVWSTLNNCAAADIRAGAGRQIWGVLYDVPDNLITKATAGVRKSLEAIEGPQYECRVIGVQRPNGSAVAGQVITYSVRDPQPALRTSLAYGGHILEGLREHGAPDEYVAYVKTRIVANNPSLAHDLVPQ